MNGILRPWPLKEYGGSLPGYRRAVIGRERRKAPAFSMRSRFERAGVLLLGRVEDLQWLVRIWHRGAQREEVPFVFGLPLLPDSERIGFLDELMIELPEVSFARLQNIKLRAALEVGDQF